MTRVMAALAAGLLAYIPTGAHAQNASLDIFRVIASHSTAALSSQSSTTGTILNSQTRVVKAVATTDVFLSFGASGSVPTAGAATGSYLPANVIREYLVSPSGVIAVRSKAGSGTIYIDELSR